MGEFLNRNIQFNELKTQYLGLSEDELIKPLASAGLQVNSLYGFGKDKSATTNNVYYASLVAADGRNWQAVVKAANECQEPREIVRGGWVANRLQNEHRILGLVSRVGISCPVPIIYLKTEDGELLVETQLVGKQGPHLRFPSVNVFEFREMEKQRGQVLARINGIDCSDRNFGTLDDGARQFATWNEYFNLKVSTTLSLLYGMYPELAKLKRLSDIAKDEESWKQFIERVAQLFTGDAVHLLLSQDNIPTLSHGDYWDGNNLVRLKDGSWTVAVIDFDRGGIEGRSFDLALWLSSKTKGKKVANPTFAVGDFLEGYKQFGSISPDINKYVAIYGLWQYLDFLVIDVIYGIDRTNKSVPEIGNLFQQLEEIGIK